MLGFGHTIPKLRQNYKEPSFFDTFGTPQAAYSLRNVSSSTQSNKIRVQRSLDSTSRYFKAEEINDYSFNSSNLVTNGDFSGGATGWTVINGSVTGGQYVSGALTAFQSGIRQVPFVSSAAYHWIEFDLVVNSGSVRVDVGTGGIRFFDTSGKIVMLSENITKLEFNAYNAGADFTLDNIVIREYTPSTLDTWVTNNFASLTSIGYVTEWVDSSGNYESLVNSDVATAPRINNFGATVMMNDLPTIRAYRVNDFLAASSTFNVAANGLQVFAVHGHAPTNYSTVVAKTPFSGNLFSIRNGNSIIWANISDGTDNLGVLQSLTESLDASLYSFQLDATTLRYRRDNETLFTDTDANYDPANLTGALSVFRTQSGTYNERGSLSELIIYPEPKTNAAQVKVNIFEYYNIPQTAATPVNLVAPVISGDASEGGTLTSTDGVWDDSVTGVTYQWQSNDVNITGATSKTYVVESAVAGTLISCVVTGVNFSGSGGATASNYLVVETPNPAVAEGLTYLQSNAKAAWDFTSLGTQPYENAPATVSDISGNGFNLNTNSGAFTPKTGLILEGANTHTFASIYTPSGIKNAYRTDLGSANLYNSDFEVHLLFKTGDGRPSGDHWIYGLNGGAARRFYIQILTTGAIRVVYNLNGAVTSTVTTNSPVFLDGPTDLTYLRLVSDFTSDSVTIYIDGQEIAATVTGSPISDINPAAFTAPDPNGIGTVMTGATTFATNPIVYCGVVKNAITDLLTDTQALQVGAWINDL